MEQYKPDENVTLSASCLEACNEKRFQWTSFLCCDSFKFSCFPAGCEQTEKKLMTLDLIRYDLFWLRPESSDQFSWKLSAHKNRIAKLCIESDLKILEIVPENTIQKQV